MKVTLTLFFLGIFFSLTLFSPQVKAGGGPDQYGYYWRSNNDVNGPAYSWIDIIPLGATKVKLLSDDNTRGPFPFNFKFHYYWYDESQFWVGSNGYIIFNYDQMSVPFPTIP